MHVQVFIENEKGSNQKNIHNEKTLKHLKTITVAQPYPYPYGFILNTTNQDGDNVDVFLLTNQSLKRGDIVSGKIIGLMEQFELSWEPPFDQIEEDHNVLAVLEEDTPVELTSIIKQQLSDFVTHVFDNIRPNKTKVGRFLGRDIALDYVERCWDQRV